MSDESPLRTLGVIGDIHCEAQALEAALRFLDKAGVDRILAVGDIVDGGGSADDCCRLLQEFKVVTVRGNHDRWFLTGEMRDLPEVTFKADVDPQTYRFLAGLPVTRTFKTVAGPLLLCHGLGEYDMGGVWPNDQGHFLESNLALLRLLVEGEHRFVINGHTHNRMVRRFDNLTIINAGTLYHDHKPCFLVVDLESGFVQFYDIRGGKKVSKGELVELPYGSAPQ